MSKTIIIFLLLSILLALSAYSLEIECGDKICHGDEMVISSPIFCPSDCREPCGDGYCNVLFGEAKISSAYCPKDCDNVCGNEICDNNESSKTCPSDCNQEIKAEQEQIPCSETGGLCVYESNFCPPGYAETYNSCSDYISRRCCVLEESSGTENCRCKDDGLCLSGECSICNDCIEYTANLHKSQRKSLSSYFSYIFNVLFGR